MQERNQRCSSSNLQRLEGFMTFVLVPEKAGFCVLVCTTLNSDATGASSIIPIACAAVAELFPNLSTATQKYVPSRAGTITLLAGLDTFCARVMPLEKSPPLVTP